MFRWLNISLVSGSTEALKWIGLVLMTGDHINKYLLDSALPCLFYAGRLAMPIFVFVLSLNMARSDHSAHMRTIKRIALFGIFSIPSYVALGGGHLFGGWLPLNIMFTLLVIVSTIILIQRGQKLAAISLVVFGGVVVEFWWPAITFGLAVYYFCLRPSWGALIVGFLSCFFLCFINRTLWVLLALPLFLIVSRFNLCLPRLKWVFYFYYPSHLALIWLVHIYME